MSGYLIRSGLWLAVAIIAGFVVDHEPMFLTALLASTMWSVGYNLHRDLS